jgi:hypothetical protein
MIRKFKVVSNSSPGLPDFSWYSIPQNRPNVQHIPLQDPTKFTKLGNFGLKIYHLATMNVLDSGNFQKG